MKDDRFYLLHIAESLLWIEEFTREGRDEFDNSRKTRDAIIRNFEIIGEAAKHLSDALKATYPDIPWKRIAGFRDILIHNYMGVDFDEVWNVSEKEAPELRRKVEEILKALG